jgi:hypothetical protein
MLAPIVLLLTASGCLGGAAATTTAPPIMRVSPTFPLRPPAYAVFHVRGTYTTGSTNHFQGDLHRYRFTIHCRSAGFYGPLKGPVSWQERLCMAILDYRVQISPPAVACGCPVSPVSVDVRGTIRGRRPVHEHITPCPCADGARAAPDARVILRTHPQKTGETT